MIYGDSSFLQKTSGHFYHFFDACTRSPVRRSNDRKKSILMRNAKGIKTMRTPIAFMTDRHIDFWASTWGKLLKKLSSLENGPCITSREGKLFQRRFRVPWQVYCELVQKSVSHKLFGINSLLKFDMCGAQVCPVEIKLLGVLRMLGRNWCADDVAEATGMGESTVRTAFNSFCDNFVTEFYETVVCRPEGLKLSKMMDVYKRMGLPGCIGSTDCVHVKWDRCPVRLYHLCKGKEGHPSLAYSCTVDHHRRILGNTQSNFGTRNDKTIVRLDTYITDVRNQLVHFGTEFDLFFLRQQEYATYVMVVTINGHA
jgi:Plant transposon protein